MEYIFPENFKWGSAVWALGTEGCLNKGGRSFTVFDEYYRLQPERFYNQVGPDKTLNWYEDYDKFAQLAQDISHNSFRTSILWARLIPDGKNINQEAVDFYRNMFTSFKKRGMELSIVLYWFDMPLLFEKQGGFTSRQVIDSFVFYCETCFQLFDDLVDIWYIYNEPIVDVMMKYQNNACYPNLMDWNLAHKAIYHMILAHAKVVEKFKEGHYSSKIGTVLNHGYIYPRSQNNADLKAAYNLSLLTQTCFEEPLLLGTINKDYLDLIKQYGAEIEILNGDLECIGENTISVLGLNIYSPERVQCRSALLNPKAPITFESFSEPYIMPGRQMNKDRGWEIYPRTIYDTLMLMKNKYGNPEMRITENGIGIQDEYRFRDRNGQIQDDYRIEYVKQHLIWAHKAIVNDANLVGYNMWSFVDLWSPSNQFKNCYGFYEYDLNTGETKRKKSAEWFKKVTEKNGFEE